MDLTAVAVTFGTIFVVELPDKTFIATLVLSTRYRPLMVSLGVGAAFALQTLIAEKANPIPLDGNAGNARWGTEEAVTGASDVMAVRQTGWAMLASSDVRAAPDGTA